MIVSHVVSEVVLAATAVGVFAYATPRLPFYNRLLWGFFMIPLALAALAGAAFFGGYAAIEPLHLSLQRLTGSLGIVAAVVATWTLINRQPLRARPYWITLAVGMVLFGSLLFPEIALFAPVLPSLGMLLIMLIAVWGLRQKQRRSIWLVLAVMAAGLATKAGSVATFLHPTDLYHYGLVLSLLAFGKAITSE